MVNVCNHVLVVLLQKFRVPAEVDQSPDQGLLHKQVLGLIMQLDQTPVNLRCNLKAKDSHTIVEHLVWRLAIQCELIASELIQLQIDLCFHEG